MDVFPGEIDSDILKDTLEELLPPGISYLLDSIKGKPDRFKADFYLSCPDEAEATNFVDAYCNQTREVLRSATTK